MNDEIANLKLIIIAQLDFVIAKLRNYIKYSLHI